MTTPRFLLVSILSAVLFPHLLPAVTPPVARTWVSNAGLDSNAASASCIQTSPCASLQAAYNVTLAGGEIDIIDDGDFGPLAITKALTIDGGSHLAAIDTAVTGCPMSVGICVNVTATSPMTTVTVRNLRISVPAGVDGGIYINSAGFLRVENVTIIAATTMTTGLAAASGAVCSVDTVNIENAHTAGSTGMGILVTGAGTKMALNNSSVTNSDYGVVAQAGGTVQIDNGVFVYDVVGVSTSGGGSGGTVRLSNSTITDNATGLQATGAGASLVSFENNRIFGNTTNGNPTVSTPVR